MAVNKMIENYSKVVKHNNYLVDKYNECMEMIFSIVSNPPIGEYAKEQVIKEIRNNFNNLIGQAKSLEESLINYIIRG